MMHPIKEALSNLGWFQKPGLWAVVDGQFGSTGKGLAASVLAEHFNDQVDIVTSNAGPNSGHTSYYGDEKIVLQQLPTFGVVAHKMNPSTAPRIIMNSGAIIDLDRLNEEVEQHLGDDATVLVSPAAAIVSAGAKELEKHLVKDVGSTGKGTGGALASKILRNPDAVAASQIKGTRYGRNWGPDAWVYGDEIAFMEISQGFSLSLNASGFYPYTTSRDCTVMQGLSDAGVHPSMYRDCMMVVRTFPIRVAGNSGPCYADQKEVTWEDLGVEPEMTTVTKKIRRVFTFSVAQFAGAVRCNRPGVIFVNFMNYLPPDVNHNEWLFSNVMEPYEWTMGKYPDAVLLGYGPRNEDVRLWDFQ